MMICPNCQRRVDSDSIYCGYCSQKIPKGMVKVHGSRIKVEPAVQVQALPKSAVISSQDKFAFLGVLFLFIAMLIYPFMDLCEGRSFSQAVKTFINPLNVFYGWMFTLPFLVLAIMSFRWAMNKIAFTREDFVCRVAGLFFVFVPYAGFTIYTVLLIASGPGALIGFILYPISMPVFIPVLYWLGYVSPLVKKSMRGAGVRS